MHNLFIFLLFLTILIIVLSIRPYPYKPIIKNIFMFFCSWTHSAFGPFCLLLRLRLIYIYKGYVVGGFSCFLKDGMLEKFRPIKIARRSYWLTAFLTKSKSILTENVLNQWKKMKKLQIAGYNRKTIQIKIKINEFKLLRIFQS